MKHTPTDPVSDYLSRIGARGGAAGTGIKKARPSEVCRAAGKKSAAMKKAKMFASKNKKG